MTHVDVYDNPERMWREVVGGTVLSANEDEIAIVKDGRKWEIGWDAGGRPMLRINEVLEVTKP